jgi:hypothetical protein
LPSPYYDISKNTLNNYFIASEEVRGHLRVPFKGTIIEGDLVKKLGIGGGT